MEELYTLTMKKAEDLKSMGYNYRCIWEHDWDKTKKDKEVGDYISSLNLVPPLNPRDSFFGGRTNATRLHYKVSGDEQIKYVDFTR